MLDTRLRIPPFNLRIRSAHPKVAAHLAHFYGAYRRLDGTSFIDFDLEVASGRGLRRYWRAQSRLKIDGAEPFLPLPADQAAPLLEWGLNWAIASRPLGYLVLHAAVVARQDAALVLPGFPGAGKSTLCASLCWLGDWRLLSDELAILDPITGDLTPNPRPIALKNESIEIVSRFPGARLGPSYADTRKGTVSHAAAPPHSIRDAEFPARCRWIVFPRFVRGTAGSIERIDRAEAFALISEQSFNKERMGESGFSALCGMLDGADCHAIEYGSTEQGLALIESICRT